MRSSASTGLAVESFTGASAEVSRRKRLRRIAAGVTVAVAAVAIVSALGSAGAWWAARTQAQSAGTEQLQASLSSLAQADDVLGRFDESYEQVFGATALKSTSVAADSRGALSTTESEGILADHIQTLADEPSPQAVAQAGEALLASQDQADEALDHLQDNDDREVANQVLASLSKKTDMVSAAVAIQASAAQASAAWPSASQAWEELVAADESARSAASALGDVTQEQVQESQEKGNQAIQGFQTAQSLLSQAAEAFPSCPFQPISDYVSLRLQALEQAQASNQALIDGDAEAALQHNDAYNDLDKQAATAALDLPSSVGALLQQAFLDDTSAARESYEQARLQSAASDAFIRDYLGTSQ